MTFVQLPRDEFRKRLGWLCYMVNADDQLNMYLILDQCDELVFFDECDIRQWLNLGCFAEQTPLSYGGEVGEGASPLWFGVLQVRKPVNVEFLVSEIFGDCDPYKYEIVVTNEPNFPTAVLEYVLNNVLEGRGNEPRGARYLEGTKSCAYAKAFPGEEDCLAGVHRSDHEFGVFRTHSKDFVNIFSNSNGYNGDI